MPELRWESIYETGNDVIDQQHHYLVELIQRITGELQGADGDEKAATLFEELLQYSRFHFVSEQNVMRNHNYPELDAHTTHHEKLIEFFEQKLTLFAEGEESVASLLDFLVDWFTLHTSHDDKKFAHYLKGE